MRTRTNRDRGTMLIYGAVLLVLFCAFVSLAVDVGRVRLAKTELQRAADAAAMYGVAGLSSGVTAVQDRCIDAANDNKCDGSAVVLQNSDIEFGTWDPSDDSFDVLTGSARAGATAIRVTAYRTNARGNAIPTVFARVLGRTTCDVKAVSVSARGHVVTPVINASGSPWLAGMHNGATIPKENGNPTDATAPANSPTQVSGVPIASGTHLAFRNTGGSTSYEDAGTYGPDGNTSWNVQQSPVNGINSTKAPLNALVGIFLDARKPSVYAQAASLDFSTTTSRNFTTLSPALKQVFFIGDGITDSGQLQDFVVPSGATRLYLGIMDENGWWWDNTGTLSTTMMDSKVTLVK